MATASISGVHRIVLLGEESGPQYGEGTISGAGSPGMNVVLRQTAAVFGRDYYSAGGTDYVGTGTEVAIGKGALKILLENSTVGETVSDAYADGDDIRFFVPRSGDVLQLLVASGETVVKGTGCGSNTAGKFVTDATNPIGEFLESSAGAPSALAADTLVRVRIL